MKILAECWNADDDQGDDRSDGHQGLLDQPRRRDPGQTLYSAILGELQKKGADARFTKVDRGQFTLNAAAK